MTVINSSGKKILVGTYIIFYSVVCIIFPILEVNFEQSMLRIISECFVFGTVFGVSLAEEIYIS